MGLQSQNNVRHFQIKGHVRQTAVEVKLIPNQFDVLIVFTGVMSYLANIVLDLHTLYEYLGSVV